MPRLRTLLLLIGDIAILFAAFLLSAWLITNVGGLWDFDFWFFITEQKNTLPSIAIVTLSVVLGMYFLDLYEKIRVPSRRRLLEDLLFAFGLSFLIQAFVSYGRFSWVMSRYLMLVGSLVAVTALLLWRSLYSSLVLRSLGYSRVAFVGDCPLSRQIAKFILDNPERGYRVAAAFDETVTPDFPATPLTPIDDQFLAHMREVSPDYIAVSGDLQHKTALAQALMRCSMDGINVASIGDLYEELFQRVSLAAISTNQLIFSPAFRPKPLVVAFQMVYGRLIALIGLLIAWPFMILTAIAVRLDSPGPAILRQIRLGQGGVPFTFLKFRSMYVDADARVGPVRAQENDPRITRVGRWIRLTRLDELPQLINVLRGDIALVGPRPEMPELEKRLLVDLPLYTQRHRIKPGITGWAQIHHEPEDSILSTARKLEYDLYYVKNMTPALDMLTIFHTFKAVLFRIGAR